MKTEHTAIGRIPAILYGGPADRAYLFLHGQMGCKEEAEPFANIVCSKGYQVLSIDLPGHGERQGQEEFAPWTAVPDIQAAARWVQSRWHSLSLRANSIGAYFAMLAIDAPDRALLVSPILDMEQLILGMMAQAGVTEEQLRAQGRVQTSFGQTLSWEYLCWVRKHPVRNWTCPVHILYGGQDSMTPRQTVEEYVRRRHARLTVAGDCEHWFHTAGQLAVLRSWEERST